MLFRSAECLRLTAADLKEFGLIDEIITEKSGWKVNYSGIKEGDIDSISKNLSEKILKKLNELSKMEISKLLEIRYRKFRQMGDWVNNKDS